jgi:hypothetical protein
MWNINGLLKDMKKVNSGNDTPRTDEECFSGPYGSEVFVPANFARQLERELIIALSKLKECERQIVQLETENMRINEDKLRLDWLQYGHGVVALSKSAGKIVFSANFEEQDWDEHEDVRKAIDVVKNTSPKCPKCGSHTQLWVNQDTKKLTCHRWGCNNVELE